MKIKTSELTGKALDWAVESIEIARIRAEGGYLKEWWVKEKQTNPSPYSTDPLRAWDIMDREKIDLLYHHVSGTVTALIWKFGDDPPTVAMTDEQTLIAAMRCWVASNMGDEVDVPEELVL